jgi:hypothetical protein
MTSSSWKKNIMKAFENAGESKGRRMPEYSGLGIYRR